MAVKTAPKGKTSKKSAEQYDEGNRGVLFQNDKDGNDSRPDLTGKITINLADFEADDKGYITVRLAAWQKNSDKVGDYYSLSASAPQQTA